MILFFLGIKCRTEPPLLQRGHPCLGQQHISTLLVGFLLLVLHLFVYFLRYLVVKDFICFAMVSLLMV
ncbi:unnamed protein product [Hymenolepis diminuta]|uniref:Ovule protein n=1 Tax=Hymenolepis diminuta TaxID=6216 RepID=A0A0R3SYF1_HYMDI|nr:unnamed protein product [Hymenolepis diminuta]